MKLSSIKKSTVALACGLLLFVSCARVPLTGRRQLNLIPESTMNQMAVSQYQSFLSSNPVVSSSSNKNVQMVKRVGSRIAAAVTRYLTDNNMADRVAGYKWQFNLVESKEANAWCMPGGKVVVYTGLLPITQNETALAVVLGHEIAHAIARHGNERMSHAMIAEGIQAAGAVALSKNPKTQNLFLQAFGVGGNLGMLAFSRQDELEADQLGLIFMAMAGYDPRQAIPFWERMSKMSNGSAPPEFLSDHPSDARRIAQIKRLMPKALKYYKPYSGK
jgi:predicted Zn-dependent protease